MRAALRASAVAALVACGGGSAAPARDPQPAPVTVAPVPPRTPYDEVAARAPAFVRALDELAGALRSATGNCANVAEVVRAWADRHSAMVGELFAAVDRLSVEEKARFQREHAADAQRVGPVLESAIDPCKHDPAVEAALDRAGFRKVKKAAPP